MFYLQTIEVLIKAMQLELSNAELNDWYDRKYQEFREMEDYYHCCGNNY